MIRQVTFNTLVAGAEYALFGLSFALVYRVSRFFHFAHGIVFATGPYAAFFFRTRLGVPFFPACFLGLAAGASLGCAMEVFAYSPLRHKRASPMVLLLASLGIYVFLQNLISLIFGDDTKILGLRSVQEGMGFLGARVTFIRLAIIVISVSVLLILTLALSKTKIGMIMRAVANDPELARIAGVESGRVIIWVFALGSSIAAIVGILVALDTGMTPTMGMAPFMMAVVAVIIGGARSNFGVVLGGLLIGFVQHITIWLLSSLWQSAIVFALLIAFLLLRPQGFLGEYPRSSSI